MATDWQVGDRIKGRWEVLDIKRGGMGIVYVVYDDFFRQRFAAKTFQDEVFSRNPAVAERFVQEGRAWIGLDRHPNITQACYLWTIGWKPFLFLEYISGGDLGNWIGTMRLTRDLPQVLLFAIQFCDGIAHALAKGIRAHRDIKPQNCLITQDGNLKITDFGLAKMFDDANLEHEDDEATPTVQWLRIGLSQTGRGAGTCTHMAPEQFEDAKHVDVRADVYSFGVMLYQMVTGHLPFSAHALTPKETWEKYRRAHQSQSPPELETESLELRAVVRTCLAKDPAQRFDNFEPVRERLVAIYQKLTGELPPQPPQDANFDGQEFFDHGLNQDVLGMHQEAIETFDSYLDEMEDPVGRAAMLNNKGAALARAGRNDEALECFSRATELCPQHEPGWSNKGAALAALTRYVEAIDCYDRALALNKRFSNGWVNKGEALVKLGRKGDALLCFDQALKIDPNIHQAWFSKGSLLWQMELHAEALSCYERAVELNPGDPVMWFDRGVALFNTGRLVDALPCFERAHRLGLPQAEAAIAQCRQMLDGLG